MAPEQIVWAPLNVLLPSTGLTVMLLGYGVGLSWGAAVVSLDPGAPLLHADYTGARGRQGVPAGAAA